MKGHVQGWMGKTHALFSIMLLCICLMIPFSVFQETIWLLKDNVLFFTVGLIAVAGGGLLPDLDNSQSSAGSTLGFMGSICTIFMQSTSSMLFTVIHTRKDRPPVTPHRYFWHTLVASAGIFCMFFFGMPDSEMTFIEGIKKYSFWGFLQDNITMMVFFLFIFMAILCGSDMVLGKIITFFKLPKILSYILPIAGLVYVIFLKFSQLRILGICIGMGYAFHCLEDFFADTGVPLLWPIPIHGKLWQRCKFFITCETGGTVNTILDLLILAIDIGLIALIFLEDKAL